MSKIV